MDSQLNRFALHCVLLASTNSLLLGYDIGVMSGAALFIKEYFEISSVKEEILVGSLSVFSLIGSLAAGKTSDAIGRRWTIILAAATFFVGAILMGLAPSFPFLIAGRIVAGVGVGYSLMIAPVYTAEVSPAASRGFLGSLPEIFINVGILIGYVSNYALSGLSSWINWRLMLGLAAVPSCGVAGAVFFMPESPRWLVMKGRTEDAKHVLRKTSQSAEEAAARLEEITAASGGSDVGWRGQGVWKELLCPSPSLQRILIAAIGLNFFMQASGNDAVVYYTPEIFKSAGIRSRRGLLGVTVIMGFVKTSFCLISAVFLDRSGRRPLLLLGTAGMSISLAGLGLGSKFLDNRTDKPGWAIALCIVSVCADVSFFSIGLGPITWVYASEIFPLRLRAQGMSLAVSLNRLVSGMITMSFLSVSEKISFGGTFFVLSGFMVVAMVFVYAMLPETKGKSLEEMGMLFEGGDSVRTAEKSEQRPV